MSKWYIILAVAVYAAIKITEAIFGESDIYTIAAASLLAVAVFAASLVNGKANFLNALLLVTPILVVVGMLILRHFLQVSIADWMIWTSGLISGVICLGFFQPRKERQF